MNAGQKYVQLSSISYFRLFLTFCTMGICQIKVRIFWEDHENLAHIPLFFYITERSDSFEKVLSVFDFLQKTNEQIQLC